MKTQKSLLAVIVLLALATIACNISVNLPIDTVRGSGDIVTEEYEVSGFDRLSLEGFGQLVIRQGEEESLTVTTDENILEYVLVNVRSNTLVLDFTEHSLNFQPTDGIRFDLVVKDLSRVGMTGAWNVEADSLEVDSLRIDLTGAGQVELIDLAAEELEVNLTGAGSLIASGEVKGQDITMSGAGSYTAGDLESETALVRITGVGTATVWATETLDVSITSVGNVIYYGSPQVLSDVSGLGKLISQGEK